MAITSNNIYSLQLLRNGAAYATKDGALNALKTATGEGGSLQNVVKKDGVAVLARYIHEEGGVKQIRTLVGYYAEASAMTNTDGASSYMTIVDVDGTAADIKELREKLGSGFTADNTVADQLAALSGNSESSSSGDTSVEGAKKYADEQVRAALDALSANSVADDNKVVSDVTQANGKVTATAKNLTEVKLAGLSATADTKITSTDTLGGALAKLQGQIDSMDKAAEAVEGQVVTTVAETDGKVTETKANVKDLKLVGYSKEANATGDIAETDTINTALSKLENKVGANKVSNTDHSIVVTEPTGATTTTDIKVNIKSGERVIKLGNNGIYTDLKLVKITTGLTANVKERYELRDSNNDKIGESIEIPTDSAYKEIYLGSSADTINTESGVITKEKGDKQSLNYAYIKADGTYDLAKVDVSAFLSEEEFKDGLQVKDHVVSVKVDTSSEKVTTGDSATVDVLTVSSNGVKVSNIQNAIDYSISKLDASVTGGDVTSNHVQVVVDEVGGKLTAVTVNEANIADADKLAALSGKTVTEAASSNNSIVATPSVAADGTRKLDIITDASKIKMTGFTDVSVITGITESSSVTDAFKKVDEVITANERTTSGALNDLKTSKIENIVVNGVTGSTSDKIASVTIGGGNIQLTGYAKPVSTSEITPTDDVNTAIGKLETKVEAAVAGGVTSIVEGNGIEVNAAQKTTPTVSVKLAAANNIAGVAENAIKFNSTDKGLYIDYLDCGVY